MEQVVNIPIVASDKEHRLNKTIEKNTSALTTNSYINIVLVCVSLIVITIIFSRSASIQAEKRIFIACVGGSILFGVALILCFTRREATTFLLFTSLCNYISGLFLGLAICYL